MQSLDGKLAALALLPPPEDRRLIRELAGVTQEDIGREVGAHQTTVHRWESGKAKPRGEQLRRYSDVLLRLAAHVERNSVVTAP